MASALTPLRQPHTTDATWLDPEETAALRQLAKVGLDQADRGEGIDAEQAFADLIAETREMVARRVQ